jgi:hypothetical protein
MKIGTLDITDLKIGTTEINEVRLGSVFVWERSSYVYLVDAYSPLAAYSLRKLSSTATNAIRVRRSSDNAEQDIGFTGNDLDTATLLSFVGASNGRVVKRYNQGMGGATYDLLQTTAVNQPVIVISGALITDGAHACVSHRNALGEFPPMLSSSTVASKTIFSVFRNVIQNVVNYLHADSSKGTFSNGATAGVNGIGAFDGTNVRTLSGEDLNRHLAYWNTKLSKLYASKDGSSESDLGSFAATIPVNRVGGRDASVIYSQSNFQEDILFTNDQTANKTAIETNINTYYGIY